MLKFKRRSHPPIPATIPILLCDAHKQAFLLDTIFTDDGWRLLVRAITDKGFPPPIRDLAEVKFLSLDKGTIS